MASREQALSLLTAAKTHTDLAVKLSSLKQAKDIILSVDLSLSSELFPYLLDLQFSSEPLVRKLLLETIEEVGLKGLEHYSVLIPVILTFIRDHDLEIAKQSIVCGMHIYTAILEELALQRGSIEPWLEELWIWTLKFKDTVLSIAYEPGSVGMKLLALKFLEMHVVLFTSDSGDAIKLVSEGGRRLFNISWVVGDHPILDPATLTSDAYRILGILLDFLRSPISHGALTISTVNCLAAVARKRPIHYGTILSALLDFNPKLDAIKGIHIASIQYSLRTAFLGFLRCTSPTIFESRERLLRALHAMNAGDAADQVIRQVDKMIRNERASRDSRLKDDQSANQLPVSGDQLRKRPFPIDDEELANDHDIRSKRVHYNPNNPSMPTQSDECEHPSDLVNGDSSIALLDSELTPAEQMIAMIGALLAEGERGAESLEILISNIHPDLLADIVVTNMKHLPKIPPLLSWHGSLPATHQIDSSSSPAYAIAQSTSAITNSSAPPAQEPVSVSNASVSPVSDISHIGGVPTDSRRDPRRDPRRLDPRRLATPVGASSVPTVDDNSITRSEFDGGKPVSLLITAPVENQPVVELLNCKSSDNSFESQSIPENEVLTVKEEVLNRNLDTVPDSDVTNSSNYSQTLVHPKEEDAVELKFSDAETASGAEMSSLMESDELLLDVSGAHIHEEITQELPQLPQYVELTENQQRSVRKLAVARIIESFKHSDRTDLVQTRIDILARLVAQVDSDDDVVVMLQKHIVADYQEQKGHELVLHVLYHLHSLMILDSNENHSSTADVYEKFLSSVAKSLLDSFPASDKSFSRLLGEVPLLPDSTLKLLGDLCYSDVFDIHGKEVRDVERVTQGLGALWSLILGRPKNRQTCLDIVLKCAVHSQEDIRAKAIRLVANKLYQLDYLADDIEQFALNMLLSAVDKHGFDKETSQPCSSDIRELEDTSICGSQVTETGNSETDSTKNGQQSVQNVSIISFPQAQRLVSLFFALCTKKPSLLQHVFDIYGRAPKTVKQAIHRLIPVLIRTLGSSYSELLYIISDPPEGCENLLMLVLQVLTQDTSPSADLIAAVKHLYETKLKDATILIPILSSLSQNEVLPIFPSLVGLPIEKFQMALAHILQGSAYTGPALTPAEVLVAIHDISPEKDGLALKKITDACSACFEQRTVFTQQVFAKALSQMVNQMPLPLLFMRTVIQAIDAFPSLVDFVMEILSKLVSKQVWKMPKLWVGFLKCVSQTSPHSFPVLLQLPPPQLESALNKHANLRGPLAAYASQSSLKSSLPRSTLAILGLGSESQMQQLHASSLYSSDNSSSVRGAS